MNIQEITSDLLDRTDGPVTEFLVIYRGVEFIKQNPTVTADDVANAIFDAIEEIRQWGGRIPSNEFNHAY